MTRDNKRNKYFYGKYRKNISKCLLKFEPRMLSVKRKEGNHCAVMWDWCGHRFSHDLTYFLPFCGQIQQATNCWHFLFFRKEKVLSFHANCLKRWQFAWNVKSYFLKKNKKNISKCRLLIFLPSMLCVNLLISRDSTDAYQEAPVCLIWAFFVRQNHNMVTFDEENDRLVDNFVQFWLKSL